MVDKWNVFDKTEFIGVLSFNTVYREAKLELKNNSAAAIDAYKHINGDKDSKWFKETLFDRIPPRNRVDIVDILREWELEEYDEWEMLKVCRLVSVNDLVWMTKGTDPMEFYSRHWTGEDCWKQDYPDLPYEPKYYD